MAAIVGKNAYFAVDDSTDTLRDLSANCTSVSLPASVDTADSTNFGDSNKTFVPGLIDHTVSIEGHFDSATNLSDATLSSLVGYADTATIEFAPDNTGGQGKYTMEGILNSYEISAPVADIVTFSASFQISGAVTRTTV